MSTDEATSCKQHHAYVKVRCRECGQEMTWGVRVDGFVPESLRCPPDEGVDGTGVVSCRRCLAPCFGGSIEFNQALDRALRRGWEPHIDAGAVLLDGSA